MSGHRLMVKTMVLPTDEELSIALQSCDATSIIAPAPKKLPARRLPSSMSDATVEELGLRPADMGMLKPSAPTKNKAPAPRAANSGRRATSRWRASAAP